MKKFLLTLTLFTASFTFMDGAMAGGIPCNCKPGSDYKKQAQIGCDEKEKKTLAKYEDALKQGECYADCHCTKGNKCVGASSNYGDKPGTCKKR